MEFWIERILHSNNWVQILFFLFLSIILTLKLIDPIQFSFFIKFLNFKQYIRRYSIDRDFNFFNLFYILILVLISTSLSFLILVCNNLFFNINLSLNEYLQTLALITMFIAARFFFTNFINTTLKIFPDLKAYYFKNIIFYGYILIAAMGLVSVLYLQDLIAIIFMKLLLIILVLIFSFHHLVIFKDYIKANPKNFLYLFYYICAFKIAPWLWMSKIL